MLRWQFQDDTDLGAFLRLLPVGLAIGLAGFAIFKPHQPEQPPSPETFTGCFVNEQAKMLFDGHSLTFPGRDLGPLKYRMVFEKYGTLAIEADSPIQLVQGRFQTWEGGWIRRMRLVHVVNSKIYGVVQSSDSDYLELTTDGAPVNFARAPASRCGVHSG